MDIFVYSDESGVFDREHNEYFVFGGLLFLSKEEKDLFARKYIHAEKCLREKPDYQEFREIKASVISNADKGKLFRSTNNCYRFGIVVCQSKLNLHIFDNKKSKQRYLDYAFKIGLKNYLLHLINEDILDPSTVNDIHVFADEHSTATNGRYELQESLLNEFKHGTFNYSWNTFFEPVFPAMGSLTVEYCDSSKRTLIRAADIIANKVYHSAITGTLDKLKMFTTVLP